MDVTGDATRKKRDWFDENDAKMQGLLEKSRELLYSQTTIKPRYGNSNVYIATKGKLREMQSN